MIPAFLLVVAQVVLLVLWFTALPTMSAWLVFLPTIAAAAFLAIFTAIWGVVIASLFKR